MASRPGWTGAQRVVDKYISELSRLNFIAALKGRVMAIRRDELVWFFGGRMEKRSRKEILGMFQRCLTGQANTTSLNLVRGYYV